MGAVRCMDLRVSGCVILIFEGWGHVFVCSGVEIFLMHLEGGLFLCNSIA